MLKWVRQDLNKPLSATTGLNKIRKKLFKKDRPNISTTFRKPKLSAIKQIKRLLWRLKTDASRSASRTV
uniref:Uncharacterized protein n=1 Tax=Anguilla anguilla TaxID=7936 RepID=A0A0E9V9U8_ANGAN